MKMKKILMFISMLMAFVFLNINFNLVHAEEVTDSNIVETSTTTEEETKTEETTNAEEPTTTEDEKDKVFEITKEDLDKIIEAAKSGNIDEVKNLLIGTIGFTAFTILMALIYFVKSKLKYIKESKLLQSATESTDEKIKALGIELQNLTNGLGSKLDDVESGVQKYYEALNSEKAEKAKKKAQEIADALEMAMSLNNGSSESEENKTTTETSGTGE